jgi:hypothetical protein
MTLTKAQWSARRGWDSVCRTSSGRRLYNEQRRRDANERRDVVWELLLKYGLWEWGVCARISRELEISRATVCRDRQHILRSMRGR